jgi:hypothetical protein
MAMGTLIPPETFVPPVKLAAAKTEGITIKLAQRVIVVRIESIRLKNIEIK